MREATNKKRYELGYHLMPEFEGAELSEKMTDIEKIITSAGGDIVRSQEPQKKHLSYPIRHQQYANFGILEFELIPESIEKINAQLKLTADVMRYLIINAYGEGKILRGVHAGHNEKRGLKSAKAIDAEIHQKSAMQSGEAVIPKPEEMEKQLEQAIEKI